ncbi:MAG: ferritin-like domain-containing protein [Actinobacteria bacterium]|nr:ferritin-like domain-containing protein [Actinomycetota bacterium]
MSDFTLGELDREGALQESLAGVWGCTRADFLGKAVVGGGALLGALAAPWEAGAAGAVTDSQILNFALTLEELQAAFYTESERSGAVRGKLRLIPRKLGAVERAHVAAIRGVLGRKAIKRPFFNFRGVTESQDAFLRTAVAFEDLGVTAYKAQASRIDSPAVLAAAVAIHSVEARHAAWMRYLVGVTPAQRAFDLGKPEGEIRSIVASTRFIVSSPNQTGRGSPRFTG